LISGRKQKVKYTVCFLLILAFLYKESAAGRTSGGIYLLYYATIMLTIAASILYHVFLKVTPPNINPMVSLAVTYLTAAMVSLALYPFYPADKTVSLLASFKELNWASYALGAAIVGLEVGTLVAYRVGWNISLFNIVASTTVSVLLIPAGLLLFKETLSPTTIAGVVFCLLGLILINYKI
jgi:drug/metabolite transporter (DMT)-like permease